MKNIFAALAVGASLLSSAHAVDFVISNNPAPVTVTDAYLNSVGNDFVGADSLAAAGYTEFCTSCTLSITSGDTITVYLVGSESADFNSLWSGGTKLTGETDPAGLHIYGTFPNGVLIAAGTGSVSEINTALAGLEFKVDVDNAGGISQNAAIGTEGFGIFYNPNDLSQVMLAFDDKGGTPEDNHDDLLVRLTLSAPEPSVWAFMILGFAGLAMMRRRSRALA